MSSPALPGDGTLRGLPASARLGLTALLAVLLGGLVASGLYVREHHQNRDERPGLSMDDLVGAYHGVDVRAPLAAALERGHPADLPAADRDRLVLWLATDDLSQGYDDIDLGDAAPAEILDAACLGCHARRSDDPIASELPLEGWEDVRPLVYAKSIRPTDAAILLTSTHAHALSLATVSLVVASLLFQTRWGRRACGLLVLGMGLGLALDLGAWWLAREWALFAYVVAASGALYALATALGAALVIADLWLPARRR